MNDFQKNCYEYKCISQLSNLQILRIIEKDYDWLSRVKFKNLLTPVHNRTEVNTGL